MILPLKMKNKESRIGYFLVLIFIALQGVMSCSKDKAIISEGNARLSVMVAGVADADPAATGKAVLINGWRNAKVEMQQVSFHTVDIGPFSMDICGNQEQINQNDYSDKMLKLGKTQTPKLSNRNLKAANIPMTVGVKYWIMVYSTVDNKLVFSGISTVGTALDIWVTLDQEYDWYAFSFNSSDIITAPDQVNPQVTSKTDQPLLYAKGKITPSIDGVNPLAILFTHQLAQAVVEVDSHGMYGKIANVQATFAAAAMKTGQFDIKTGAFSGALTDVDVGSLTFTDKVVGETDVKISQSFYTADVTAANYGVTFSALSLELPDASIVDLSSQFPNGGTANFTFTGNTAGKIMHGLLKLWKVIPLKTILHAEGNSFYSYGASNPLKASGAFLYSTDNFGPTSNYVRTEGFTRELLSPTAGSLNTRLADHSNYPDVIIAGIFDTFNAADLTALTEYINRGGLVFYMAEIASTPVVNFMKGMFGAQTTVNLYDAAGAIYTINDQDKEYLAGPFGDVRGKYWGQDGSSTIYLNGIPDGTVEVISTGSRNFAPRTGVTMFRHKTKHFFYSGDASILSCQNQSGPYTSNTIEPYEVNSSYFPVTHLTYGAVAAASSLDYPHASGSWSVDNSLLFANIFSVMLGKASYTTIDRSP